MKSVDPNLPLLSVSTIDEDISRMMGNDDRSSSLTGIFALLALVLAAIGLYGVMSYKVAQRTNEIGVRLGPGAQRQNVLWIVLREALLLLSAGVVLGLPISLAAARFVRNQLFGLKPDDPLTYSGALVVVSSVIILSAWLPAARSSDQSGRRASIRITRGGAPRVIDRRWTFRIWPFWNVHWPVRNSRQRRIRLSCVILLCVTNSAGGMPQDRTRRCRGQWRQEMLWLLQCNYRHHGVSSTFIWRSHQEPYIGLIVTEKNIG